MPEETPEGEPTRLVVQLTKGTSVGHYRIVEKIGSGGMGEVYLAEDTELNRKVALKFLSPHLCQDADCRARFKREAQAAAKLNHPNIVTIHEVSEFNGRPFFAMEHVEGQSLRELIRAKDLPIERVMELAIQICEGLHKAHQSGIVHRDVKPANILIDADGRAKILDFGLASVVGSDHLTKTGSTLGTVGYMSPEQVHGEHVDYRTDIFSLGVVLYELITGRQPFKGDNDTATSRNIIDQEPEPLARYKSGVNAEFQRVINKALAKDKSVRYQHADELAADMKQLLSPSGSVPVKRSRRMRIVVPLLIVIVLSAIALVFKPWELINKSSDEATTENKRVVVVPFRNQTGDPSLDPLGRMVADWTTQSLLQTGLAEVIPPERLSQLEENQSIGAIAKATGASTIVTGSYYKLGETIQLQAKVMDANEKLLVAIDPVTLLAAKTMDGVESVRQRVLGALAVVLDERLKGWAALEESKPPSYEAYQQYIQGQDLFLQLDNSGALEYFKQAYAIDTSFVWPLYWVCFACWNLGQYAQADSLVRFLNLRRAQLTPLQQLWLDDISSWFSGDFMKGLNAMRKAAKIAPGSLQATQLGLDAFFANRPRECIEAYKELDPQHQWVYYWTILAGSYHILEEHERELEVIREGRKRFPNDFAAINSEIAALAALGRIDEIKKLIEESITLYRPGGGSSPGGTMRLAARELRAHGYDDAEAAMYNQAIQWYESRPDDERRKLRNGYAATLYSARRWDEAKSIFEDSAKKSPDNPDCQAWLGLVAARKGDRETALKISEWLRTLNQPYLFGSNTYSRACIAAVLGEKNQAIVLLKEARQQGNGFGTYLHTDFDLESLWDYPPFIEFLKPKG